MKRNAYVVVVVVWRSKRQQASARDVKEGARELFGRRNNPLRGRFELFKEIIVTSKCVG